MGFCKRKGVMCEQSSQYCSVCIDARCEHNLPDYTVEDVLSDLRSTYSFAPESLANTLLLRAATLIETYRELATQSMSKFDPFIAGYGVRQTQLQAQLTKSEAKVTELEQHISKLEMQKGELEHTIDDLEGRLAMWDSEPSGVDIKQVGDYYNIENKMILINREVYFNKFDKVRDTYKKELAKTLELLQLSLNQRAVDSGADCISRDTINEVFASMTTYVKNS